MNPVVAAAKGFARSVDALSAAVHRARLARTRRAMFAHLVARNPALVRPRSPVYLRAIDRYWRQHYGRPVDPRWHVACANVTGVEDPRFVPHFVWWDEIVWMLNEPVLAAAHGDKNLCDALLGREDAPATVVRRMHGRYHDGQGRPLDRDEVAARLFAAGCDRIAKPARGDNGEGIARIVVGDDGPVLDGAPLTLAQLERTYGDDFLVQDRIDQHLALAAPHPASVNTLRIVTLRWNGERRVLFAFARFGTAGRATDNAGTGGLCCGIDDDGRLHDAAVDEAGRVHATHPTTGYAFAARAPVPGFAEARRRALDLHVRLPHFDLVSWDVAINARGVPVVVEANFRGASFVYQFACRRPIFGDLTDDILARLRERRR